KEVRHFYEVFRLWDAIYIIGTDMLKIGRFFSFPYIYRGAATQHKGLSRNLGYEFIIHIILYDTAVGYFAYKCAMQVPFFKNGFYFVFAAFFYNHEHALLGFGKEYLKRLHIWLPCWSFIKPYLHACARFCGHFRGGTGNACRTHIL